MWIEKIKTGYAFRETYVDPLTKKRRKVSITKPTNTRTAKKAAYEELRLLIAERTKRRESSARLADILDAYIKKQKPLVKQSTNNSYELFRRRFLSYFPEETLIDSITAPILQDFLDFCASTWSADTANHALSFLRGACKLAMRLGVIDTMDVLTRVTVSRPKPTLEDVKKKYNKFLSKNELFDVLKRISEINKPVALVCEFQALTGLRFGELAALREQDYNGSEVSVTATLVWAQSKGDKPHRGTPKNLYSVRTVKLDSRAIEIADHFKLHNQRRRLWAATAHDDAGETWLFTNRDGGPYDLSFVNRTLRKISYKKHLSTHIFRHTHISLLAEAGVPLKAIMQRVGHNCARTTLEVYTHANKEMEAAAVQAIEKISL